MNDEAGRAAEAAARRSYGRLVALAARRTRDLAAAEDALAEAFAAALRAWPVSGVPANPEAWLLVAARREAGRAARRGAVRAAALPALEILEEEMRGRPAEDWPDERLKLLFACAHPAIDPAIRTPLMLQTVLGLDAARIAAAFAVAPAAMGQRLVRAKAKIRAAGVPFGIPPPEAAAERLGDVLEAIYAAYGAGWDALGEEGRAAGLAAEALELGRLVAALAPGEPEAQGLLALMLYAEARRTARRDAAGDYAPLAAQDRRLWDGAMIAEAEGLLRDASRARRFGRFQAEAALQSLHVTAPPGQGPDPAALALLYDLLAERSPTLGALIGRAVAQGALHGPRRGLALLDEIAAEAAAHQPWWAARLHLALAAGDRSGAEAARARALLLTRDPAVRRFLAGR